jgi:hypothetical protein
MARFMRGLTEEQLGESIIVIWNLLREAMLDGNQNQAYIWATHLGGLGIELQNRQAMRRIEQKHMYNQNRDEFWGGE